MRSTLMISVFGFLFFIMSGQRLNAATTNWVYEAETSPRGWSEAATAVKDPDASGGMARVSYPAVSRRANVMFSGPMTMEQLPGIYRAIFRLKVADHTNEDTVARLWVWQEGMGEIASREIKSSEFTTSGKYQDFTLEFTRTPGGLIACSVTWLGGHGDTPEPVGTATWIDKVTFEQVHAFSATEINERFPQAWQPMTHVWPLRQGPLRVLVVRGPYYPWFQLEEALALLPVADIRRCNFGVTIQSGDYQIKGSFPVTREELFKFDVVVLVDVDAYALGVQRRQMLGDFVRAGGGMLVCGGPFAYGKGRYVGTELEDVLPVLSNGPWDWKSAPTPISPDSQHKVTAGVGWKPAPYVLWYHTAKVRPDATVVLEAGKDPLLVVETVGKGRSAALLATALGKAQPGQVAFWDWPSWSQIMANTLRWLAGRELSAGPDVKPDIPVEENRPLIVAETMENRITLLNPVPGDGNPASSSNRGLEGGFKRLGPVEPRDLGLVWPCGLARDAQGRIYIADFGNDRLLRVDDLAGNGLVVLGEYGDQQPPDVPGSLSVHFHMPYGVAIDSRGHIYVSDAHNARLVRFDDMTGANWVQIGDRVRWDAERNHFNWPLGIALDAQDRVYIADSRNGRIVRVDDMDGKGWTVCDGGSSKDQKFHTPTAVSIGPDGAIYVADSGNDRIVRISDMDGSNWQSIEDLDQPVSVVVTSDGRLYVGLAHKPGIYVFRSIKGGGLRVLSTKSGPRGILITD